MAHVCFQNVSLPEKVYESASKLLSLLAAKHSKKLLLGTVFSTLTE